MKICVIYSKGYNEKILEKNIIKNYFKIKYEKLIIILAAIRNMTYINPASSVITLIFTLFWR